MKKLITTLICLLFFTHFCAQEKKFSDGPFDQLIIRGATLINGNGSPPLGPVDIVIEKNIIKLSYCFLSWSTVGYTKLFLKTLFYLSYA